MDADLAIALAAGGFSLVATGLSVLANGRIARANDEVAARRAYEYEALKRLYTEVEPLLYQVESAAAAARDRVVNLARASRTGALDGPKSWLAEEGYYLASTLHALLRPAVYHRLLERRITSIDLGLDPQKAIVFALLREYDRAFGADFDLAGQPPKLDYDPNSDSELPTDSGGRFRQGLVAGRRDILVDSMIVREPGEAPRMRNFGELEEALARDERLRHACAPLTAILAGFSPSGRPVFWRILLLQGVLARLILEAMEPRAKPLHLKQALARILENRKWIEAHHTMAGGAHDPGAIEAVRSYLDPKLGAIARRHIGRRQRTRV